MNNLETILWPAMHRLEPESELGGIYANKRGYHNMRKNLPVTDYSVGQFVQDRRGPDDEACAIDWTFRDAQRGDYKTIKVYSKRLLVAGRTGDPRTKYWREFFGNADDDREVEGWDFAKNRPSTSDTSHLWHIHLSEHREYIGQRAPAEAMASLLAGEPYAAYQERIARKVTMVDINGKLPELKYGDTDDTVPGGTTWVRRAQALCDYLVPPCAIDGEYGDQTASAIKRLMVQDTDRSTLSGREINLPEWRRLYGIWG